MLILSKYIFISSLILILYVTLVDSTSPLLITFVLTIFCIGQIVPSTILYPLCLNFMPEAKGRVSAMIQGFRLMMTAFSLQLAGYFYQGSFQNIGFIIFYFITLAIVMLFFVLKNDTLMKDLQKK
ncbi:MAG: hypothetical protein ACRYGR_09470 [Janthinobacterium lividum]